MYSVLKYSVVLTPTNEVAGRVFFQTFFNLINFDLKCNLKTVIVNDVLIKNVMNN